MPKSNAVWGIDIGQCALKAMRCVPGDDPSRITVDAFDFIEYPKILSQPEADPAALVQDALKQFLSRNKVKGDRVAISVPGQSGLARFIKLPPVESKKIPDIVNYEARQQIPFAMEDVVWDYQQMAGGSEEDGFALETEVGLFAMKRDQAFRVLKPFNEAGIEVDIVQLTPLAIYNFVVFDQLQDLPPIEQYDPKDPPPSIVVISLGTDTTDLVITNGYRVWQRNIPLGGNQFTKALTKELKLTFTKAEHLKRNATKAEDPRAVFLAMKQVFNDLANEVQRSISFFQSVDRTAKIGKAITLGNATKLRGLQKFLAQSLGYEVVDMEEYRGLSGPAVLGAPAFKENLLSFGVCYGLCLQGLKRAELETNLIPPEIVKDRLIRAKKPWAVASVGAMLLALSVGFFGFYRAWSSSRDETRSADGTTLAQAKTLATSATNKGKGFEKDYQDASDGFKKVLGIGNRLDGIGPRRLLWIDLLDAINQCQPHDENDARPSENKTDDQLREMLLRSKRVEIDSIECEHFSDLKEWFDGVKDIWANRNEAAGGRLTAPPSGQPVGGAAPEGGAAEGPTGDGWVIQIEGHHYHNDESRNEGPEYVRKGFLKNLENKVVELMSADGTKKIKRSMRDLGVGYPVMVNSSSNVEDEEIPRPGSGKGSGQGRRGAAAGDSESAPIVVPVFHFRIQFAWKETPLVEPGAQQPGPGGEKPPAYAGVNGGQ